MRTYPDGASRRKRPWNRSGGVNVNGATAFGQLTNLKACPGTAGFNQAKLTMLQAGCNHAQDVIRLRYTIVSGGTALRPEIGECVRDGAVVLTRSV